MPGFAYRHRHLVFVLLTPGTTAATTAAVDRRYNKLGVLLLASAAAVAEAKHVFVVDNAKRELA